MTSGAASSSTGLPNVEPRFSVEFIETTNEIMLTASYPAGCRHRTTMTRATLLRLLREAATAYRRSAG